MRESLCVSTCVETTTTAVNMGDQCLIWLLISCCVCGTSLNDTSIHPGSLASSYSLRVFRFLPVPLPACLPARPTVRRLWMRTKNSRGVSALVATLRHFLPAFVLATCCRAGLSLKAEMLAGYGLCIIDADCDWALRAIGYNFKKSKKVVNSGWTRRVFSRIRRRWRLLKPRVERRPDSGDVTSLLVHF